MLLRINGVGRLATDVTLRYLPSGVPVANFSFVSGEKIKTKNGEQKEDVCFIEATVFSKLAEICNQYLKKGSKIYIDGKIKQSSWTDQQGVKRSKHSITVETLQMMDSRQDSANEHQQSRPNVSVRTPDGKIHDIPDIDINDDEIPF